MNITYKILSIPPYISTAWKNIVSLQVEARPFGHALVIELLTGRKVEIPNLDRQVIEKVFFIHAKVVEEEGKEANVMTASLPFPFSNLGGFTTILQHNPGQKDAPDLPQEMLEKITEMAKNFLPEDTSTLDQAEPGCNCPYCQILRAFVKEAEEEVAPVEEEVTDEDLKFRSWDIKQDNDKLYSVTNPLDKTEHYTVFLGSPLGCTCGHKNCEHIQAVLRS